VRYYSQHTILSAGLDRSFRMFSTIQDQQSRELSQGHMAKKAKHLHVQEQQVKLPPVLDFSAATLRENDWANVLTCHHDDPAAYTWLYKNAVLGKHVLRPPALDKAARTREYEEKERGEKPIYKNPMKRGANRVPGQVVDPEAAPRRKGGGGEHEKTRAKCVCVTACGNYGVVGYACGRIDRYNMQSGAHRGTYWVPSPAGHEGGVFGVAVTALNEELVSGAFDGTIKIWDFDTQALLHTMTLGSPVAHLTLNRDNLLLAVACDDLRVRVLDISSRRIVRDFAGHSNRITDTCVSPDGRWLLTSSADCTLRVHDIPTARLIDWVRFDKAVTGVSVSPTGDFIATSHADSVGIFLWANRTHFANIFLGFTPPAAPAALALPSSAGPGDDAGVGEVEVGPDDDRYPVLVDQLAPSLVTFSTVPKARWQTLANLDVIKLRN
ncbi:WD40-repeat-containing domain protein, partial [Baffinella frigidus]